MKMIEEACSKIVSPPKFKYNLFDLGIPYHKTGSIILENGRRYDFQIHNKKKLQLQCSLYMPAKA